MRHVVSILTLMLVAGAGCTRNTQTSSVTLSFSRSGQSAEAVAGKLNFAVVNVQLPTGPIVKNFEFDDNGPSSTDTFTMELPDVPRGTFLIQFLGVYEQDGSPSVVTYGFQNANINAAEQVVNITAGAIGQFTREGRVNGRYLTSIDPDAGPTGDLLMKYQPPDASQPPITIQKWPMIDGYFTLLALDGAEMSYSFNGENIFPRVKLDGQTLYMNGAALALDDSLMRISKPASAHRDGGSSVRLRPPSETFVGFFRKPGVTGTLKKVCYANNVNEGVRGEFRPDLTQPIDINLAGTAAANTITGLGGRGTPASTLYTDSETLCPTVGNLVLYHTMIGADEDLFKPPFVPANPWINGDNFVRTRLVVNSGLKLRVAWKLLPNLSAGALDGFAVLAKNSSNWNGGGGQETCDKLFAQGYQEVATVPGTITTYDLPVDSSNFSNWRVGICAFKQSATGRQYLGKYVTGGSLTNQNAAHTGWAPSAQVATYSTSSASIDTLANATPARVLGVTVGTGTTALVLSASPGLQAGDEIMITVAARGTSGACGQHNAQAIAAGDYDFARVLSSSGSSLTVTPGSLLDDLNSAVLATAPTPTTAFCAVQINKVAQFRDLTLSNFSVTPSSPIMLGSVAGGVIPLRVNGTMIMNGATLSTFGKGLAGGASYGTSGAGDLGVGVTSVSSNGSGGGGAPTGISAACGGAGAGYGGTVSGNCGGGVSAGAGGVGYGLMRGLTFGGGGGGAAVSGAPGGGGGGVTFLAVRNLVLTGANLIDAGGAGGSVSPYWSGGGGGGSVFLAARNVTGASALSVSAQGGGGYNGAGSGGGGSIQALFCQTSGGSPTLNVGAGSSTASGGNGMASYYDANSSAYSYLCQTTD